MKKSKNILICPLEWGLGHAGRMIPVASMLTGDGHNVFIGSGEEVTEFFRSEIKGLSYIHFPGFRIRYSRWLPQYVRIILSAPSFFFHICREHRQLKKIIRDYRIDVVISDSRLGLWNREIRSALVTHMVRIPFPGWLRFPEKAGTGIVKRLFSRFDFCFIPDMPGGINVAGKLSHADHLPANALYTGILSRFGSDINPVGPEKYFCTVILSGPEPQRSILKKRLVRILESKGKKSIILEGRPGENIFRKTEGNIEYINHLPAIEMKELILSSEFIISRSGYTTLMELISLGKTAVIIPTPGQSEQEYLASYMSEKQWFTALAQNLLNENFEFNLARDRAPSAIAEESRTLLRSALGRLLQ